MIIALVALCTAAAFAQANTPASCQQFVQGFYDWYVRHDSRMDEALKLRKADLTPVLLRKLLRDNEANAKAEEVVGLDWDPFTASQDPEPRFQAQKARVTGKRCQIPVYGVDEHGKRRLAVTAILDWTGQKWVFADFLEDNSSLIKILDGLEYDRQKQAKGAAKSKHKD